MYTVLIHHEGGGQNFSARLSRGGAANFEWAVVEGGEF